MCLKKSKSLMFLTLILLFIMASPVLAANGNGSGGGQDEPLSLSSSNPADGQKDIPVGVQIKLTFNKNVVNMAVKDNNLKCFSLYAKDQELVPVTVSMGDDQIEPDKKRDIVLIPKKELQGGTPYTIRISPQLQAKSGPSLGKELKINFTTVAAQKNTDNSGNSINTTKSTETTATDTNKNTKSVASTAKEESKQDTSSNSGLIIGIVCVALVGGLIYGYYKRRHK